MWELLEIRYDRSLPTLAVESVLPDPAGAEKYGTSADELRKAAGRAMELVGVPWV